MANNGLSTSLKMDNSSDVTFVKGSSLLNGGLVGDKKVKKVVSRNGSIVEGMFGFGMFGRGGK